MSSAGAWVALSAAGASGGVGGGLVALLALWAAPGAPSPAPAAPPGSECGAGTAPSRLAFSSWWDWLWVARALVLAYLAGLLTVPCYRLASAFRRAADLAAAALEAPPPRRLPRGPARRLHVG